MLMKRTSSWLKKRWRWIGVAVLLCLPWIVQKAIFCDGRAIGSLTWSVVQNHEKPMQALTHQRLANEPDRDRFRLDPRFTAQTVVQHKIALRRQMLQTGASAREVDAVLKRFNSVGLARGDGRGGIGKSNSRIYVLPEFAERHVLRGQPIWVIGSHWESIVIDGGCSMTPVHVWHVAIRGVWPYDALYSTQCD